MITIPHATEAIRTQAFQTHTAAQPISIQPLQTQQKPRVTKVRHNAEKHSLFSVKMIVITEKLLKLVNGDIYDHEKITCFSVKKLKKKLVRMVRYFKVF